MVHKLNEPDGKILTVEYALDVYVEDVVPALLFREIIVRAAPSNARVVNKDVECRLAPFEFCDESIAARFRLFDMYQVHSQRKRKEHTPTSATM